jgi:hypothetical protein
MWLRLRQICLVAAELAPVEEAICDILDVKVCYRDPKVGRHGLENALFPIGNQLLEVVAPTEENTAGGRYLERRGGDGGYMVITQCDEHAPRKARVDELGFRIVGWAEGGSYTMMQLHPKDNGGSFFEISEELGPNAHDLDGPWTPAGDDWKASQSTTRVNAITAAEVQVDDPAQTATRWSEIAQIPLDMTAKFPTMAFENNASVRFVPCSDGRPEGLGSIDIKTTDKDAILAAAEKRGAVTGKNQVYICGTRMNLV